MDTQAKNTAETPISAGIENKASHDAINLSSFIGIDEDTDWGDLERLFHKHRGIANALTGILTSVEDHRDMSTTTFADLTLSLHDTVEDISKIFETLLRKYLRDTNTWTAMKTEMEQ